jgi:hypothetical protein
MYILRNLWRDRVTIISMGKQKGVPFLSLMYLVTVDNAVKTESNAMYAQQCVLCIVVAANSMKHA